MNKPTQDDGGGNADRSPLDYAGRQNQRTRWFDEWWERVVFAVILGILAFCFMTLW